MSYQSRSIIVTLTITVLIYTVFLIAYELVYNYFEYKVLDNINVTLEENHATRFNRQRRI